MDRKEGAAGFPSLISIVSRMCPGPLVAILVLGLAFQPVGPYPPSPIP